MAESSTSWTPPRITVESRRWTEYAVTVKYDDGSLDEWTMIVPEDEAPLTWITHNPELLPRHVSLPDARELRVRALW